MNAPSRIAPPFPLNPTVGERHGNWVWNGVIWTCSPTTGIQVLCTVFTVSGPYMPSPGLVSVVVETIGGGGASGAVMNFGANNAGGSGGGGSGGYSRKTLPASLVLGGVQVTIGAGGIGGNGAGGAGQATTFGALCVANGGGGGGGNNTIDQDGEGGQGASPGVGDVALPGNWGDKGDTYLGDASTFAFTVAGGRGGSMWGGAGQVLKAGPSGAVPGAAPAPNTGAGGGGCVAHSNAGTTGIVGTNGATGLCIVTEYCWADASGSEDCMNPPINVNARVAIVNDPCWPGPGPCPPGWGQVTYEGDD